MIERIHGPGSTPMRMGRLLRAVTLSLAWAWLGGVCDAAETGQLEGRAVAQDSQKPLGFTTVQIPALSRMEFADEEGRFSFDALPTGTWSLTLTRIGYRTVVRSDVVVRAGRTTSITVAMTEAPLAQPEVTINADFIRPGGVTTTAFALDQDEIRRAPGAIEDLSRLVQSLPAVTIGNDERNDIIARGGSPSENLIRVDGLEVPYLNHFASQGSSGGALGMVGSELVQNVLFLAGAFPPQYGDRVSSVLDVKLREGGRTMTRAELGVNLAGASALLEGPLPGGDPADRRGSWLVSVRQSYFDLLQEPFDIPTVPQTTSWLLKSVWEPAPNDRIELLSLGGRDEIDFRADPRDLDDPAKEDSRQSGARSTTGITWRHIHGDHGFGTVTVQDSEARFQSDVEDLDLDGETIFRDRSRTGTTTVRYDLDWKLRELHVRAGAAADRARFDYALDQPVGVESPYSADSSRVDAVRHHAEGTAWRYGTYAEIDFPLLPQEELRGTIGGRVDRFDVLNVDTFGPRAAISWQARPNAELSAAWGRYHQEPDLVYVTAAPENRALRSMRADHTVVGLTILPHADLRATVEVYRKDYDDYPVAVPYPTLSLANAGDLYGVSGLLFPMTSAGTGRSRGVELHVQKKLTRRVYGQLGYTYSRVEHAAADGIRRRGAFDIPHAFTCILGYKTSSWEASMRFRYADGKPYTPVLDEESRRQNRAIYDTSRMYALRGPAYHRLDVRTDRYFRAWGRSWSAYVEVQDLYDRENVFLYAWNSKTESYGPVPQISLLGVFGLRVSL